MIPTMMMVAHREQRVVKVLPFQCVFSTERKKASSSTPSVVVSRKHNRQSADSEGDVAAELDADAVSEDEEEPQKSMEHLQVQCCKYCHLLWNQSGHYSQPVLLTCLCCVCRACWRAVTTRKMKRQVASGHWERTEIVHSHPGAARESILKHWKTRRWHGYKQRAPRDQRESLCAVCCARTSY